MKKLLWSFCVVLIFSGCSGAITEIHQIETEKAPTSTATIEGLNTIEITTTIEATNTIEPTSSTPERRNIILFIGDGMGSEHRLAGQYYSVGEVRQLKMDTLSVSGWLHTDSFGGELTDSAASATALATGYKTYNDVLSFDTNGNQLKTILEYAQELDMSVGLVSTDSITSETPAAFGAHTLGGEMGPEIAAQFLEHGVDVLFGGGENEFLPSTDVGCHPDTGKRFDERNLIEEAEDAGYTFVCDVQSFDSLEPQTNSLVIGLFADESMIRPHSPSLADMTQTAIEILSLNPNGFFLVVEAGMIDIASHRHESQNMLDYMVGLDQAVIVGMEYAELDENTLIIVTADHETGGLHVDLNPSVLYSEDGLFYMPNGTEFYISWSTARHTHADVPVSAYGPGSERLRGINENTVVFDAMLEFLGIAVIEE